MTEVRVSLRDRKRAATIDEIKTVAISQLSADAGQMTLRGVAREVGMTVQSLYHYFPSRDDLITALIADAHNALADAIEAAGQAHPDLVGVASAYRGWAVEHRARFLLIFGTPVPGYAAPPGGPTTDAARRLGVAFTGAVFHGWSPADLAAIRPPAVDPALDDALTAAAALVLPGMPPAAFGWGLDLWGRVHGLVLLELLGHLPWLGDQAAANFHHAALRAAADLARLRP
ncbi:AcrR family transcriptional regulator [Allocatelliglobosispora scoriae]|uniref:AcrR family transcriptional regulator n=1 Tax=Allocatelliglobosispora scoriae TaxID=643052 RepID=A0A841BJU9_9ACTN|nr:TetR/AcrR family transcriptional regulator [Allocatelliglobosispora scoriae]MBB5867052.1 AcrR family transcriptional regulator [Allocatelliglobosispora scoriae]